MNNRIWLLASSGTLTVYRASANYANGLAIDREGRLLTAENGDPLVGTPARITRTDLRTQEIEVLTDSFDGRAFNAPNDLVVDVQPSRLEMEERRARVHSRSS